MFNISPQKINCSVKHTKVYWNGFMSTHLLNSTTLYRNTFGTVKQRQINGHLTLIDVEYGSATAVISLYGGQVLSWQPENQRPVFWLSETADHRRGKAIRGGVPICWPWFGPYRDDTGKIVKQQGNHGFARNSCWQLSACKIEQGSVDIELSLSGDNHCTGWPNKYQLQQALRFSDTLQQKLIITNLSAQTVHFSAALHSYFAVSHPKYVTVDTLSTTGFTDKLNDTEQASETLANCIGPIDRIYHTSSRQELIDSQWQRKLIISASGCQQWVLWNPGKAIAATMDDIHQQGENQYVCLEAANTDKVSIAPMKTTTMSQLIAIEEQG